MGKGYFGIFILVAFHQYLGSSSLKPDTSGRTEEQYLAESADH